MVQDPYDKKDNGSGSGGAFVRTAAGIILLTIGSGVAVWILQMIGGMITAEKEIPLVVKIVSSTVNREMSNLQGGAPPIHPSFQLIAGYLLVILLISVCAGIAKAFINAGVKTMQPDYKEVLNKIKTELKRK